MGPPFGVMMLISLLLLLWSDGYAMPGRVLHWREVLVMTQPKDHQVVVLGFDLKERYRIGHPGQGPDGLLGPLFLFPKEEHLWVYCRLNHQIAVLGGEPLTILEKRTAKGIPWGFGGTYTVEVADRPHIYSLWRDDRIQRKGGKRGSTGRLPYLNPLALPFANGKVLWGDGLDGVIFLDPGEREVFALDLDPKQRQIADLEGLQQQASLLETFVQPGCFLANPTQAVVTFTTHEGFLVFQIAEDGTILKTRQDPHAFPVTWHPHRDFLWFDTETGQLSWHAW